MASVSSPSGTQAHPIRVLLVDDAARVRSELRRLLELSGLIEVAGEAGDGLEAIRLAAQLSPDVILMDLEMPTLDGLEATRQIKALQPAPRVVILSVHARPDEVESAREAGADCYVVKGADYHTLVNAILDEDPSKKPVEKGEKS